MTSFISVYVFPAEQIEEKTALGGRGHALPEKFYIVQ